MDTEDRFDFSEMEKELVTAMYAFRGDENMEAFEARAAAARRIVHDVIMGARVWFMKCIEGGDA